MIVPSSWKLGTAMKYDCKEHVLFLSGKNKLAGLFFSLLLSSPARIIIEAPWEGQHWPMTWRSAAWVITHSGPYMNKKPPLLLQTTEIGELASIHSTLPCYVNQSITILFFFHNFTPSMLLHIDFQFCDYWFWLHRSTNAMRQGPTISKQENMKSRS